MHKKACLNVNEEEEMLRSLVRFLGHFPFGWEHRWLVASHRKCLVGNSVTCRGNRWRWETCSNRTLHLAIGSTSHRCNTGNRDSDRGPFYFGKPTSLARQLLAWSAALDPARNKKMPTTARAAIDQQPWYMH